MMMPSYGLICTRRCRAYRLPVDAPMFTRAAFEMMLLPDAFDATPPYFFDVYA